ncbi:MAG: hypothetical protein JSU82_08350 [Rhodospirillales bacterium]|nr:MAG: hypothetical protein JSU82_08350 [Rhodospirillales bacterium]
MAYIITVEEATRGLFAAWFMFVRDKRAAMLLENTYLAAVKSYWAALIVLPLYMIGTTIEFLNPSDDVRNFAVLAGEAGLFNATVAEFCIFVLCWFVAWPLVLDRITPYLGTCDGNFFRYIAAYNWMRVTYVLVGLLFVTLHFAGLVPPHAAEAVALTVLLVLWSYHWFVLRHALGVNSGMAALLVAVEFMFVTTIKAVILATAL